jgi:hypothetical protein
MLIEEKALKHWIDNFFGYGSWHARFWFIGTHKPEVVLMYGMNNINTLKKSAQDFFDGANFKMIKATKRQIPQHHRAELNGTTMLITTQIPALRHNRIETGFDWEEFGKRVKAKTDT